MAGEREPMIGQEDEASHMKKVKTFEIDKPIPDVEQYEVWLPGAVVPNRETGRKSATGWKKEIFFSKEEAEKAVVERRESIEKTVDVDISEEIEID